MPLPMEALSKRPLNRGMPSQSHHDIIEDRYQVLRRPKKVKFYCNGDRFFKGKKMSITPNKFPGFTSLLSDLTTKLPSLSCGVRKIYTPVGGRPIFNIEDLQDGQSYVCAGFEIFKPMVYGEDFKRDWKVSGYMHKHDPFPPIADIGTGRMYGQGAFAPGKHLRHSYPKRSMGAHIPGNKYAYPSDTFNPMKPKVITIITNTKPRATVKMLLNKRGVVSYEQLKNDIADSFGPKWKNNKISKLYSLKGRELVSIGDFFRDDEVFIGIGKHDNLSVEDVEEIREELHIPQLVKQPREKKHRRPPVVKYSMASNNLGDDSKRDSGYAESESKYEDMEVIIDKTGDDYAKGSRDPHQRHQELQWRLDRQKQRAANEERERARKRMQKRLADDKRILDEEKRKRNLAMSMEDPFRKMDRERKEAERKEREAAREEQNRLREQQMQHQRELERQLEQQKRLVKQLEQEKKEQQEKESKAPHDREHLSPERKADASPDRRSHDRLSTGANDVERGDKTDERVDNNPETVESDKANNNSEKIDNQNKVKENTKDGAPKEKRKKSRTNTKFKLGRNIHVANDTVYAKYSVGKILGDGNFAVVNSCTLNKTGQEYAMKIIDKSKLKGKEHMIENEIDIMKHCHHQNIVKLYEEYETNTEIFLIMELIKGGDLFDAITQSVKFNEKEAASMCHDVTNALFYMHSRNIVHRDLKPENLMVCRNKDNTITLKLGDYGLAMDIKEPIYTVCGTPTYVAPEILTEIGYGLEVDLWALGVITYILLCGFPPFRSPDRNQTELFEFIKAGEFEYLSPYWDGISDSARDLISHLLVVNKRKRFTAVDVLCHPWAISCGNSLALPDNFSDYQQNLREQLQAEARGNLDSYIHWKKHRFTKQHEP